jgi:ATP phosphoribosyltransferase regulatory subunit HisZ
MARRSISIDEKIEQQKKIVFNLKDKYEAALAELDKLQQKRIELKNKELLKAIENSSRSFDEIMAFLGYNDEAEE